MPLRPRTIDLLTIALLIALLPALSVAQDAESIGEETGAITRAAEPAAPGGDSSLAAEPTLVSELGVRQQDAVWMVSTRHIPWGYTGENTYYRLGESRWDDVERTTFDTALKASREDTPIVVYVHGNRMGFQQAADRGRRYYEQLAAAGGPAMHFVVWSWPSGQIKGQLRDVRAKAARADFEGELLAGFLRTTHRRPLTLIGYSYGARVISGALVEVAEEAPQPSDVQSVFLAPALDVNWLGPGNYQSRAWTPMRRLMVLFNNCDPALKRFRYSDPCYRPVALGYAGPWWVGQTPGEVDAENVSGIVGKSHAEMNYLGSGYLMNRLRGFISGAASSE